MTRIQIFELFRVKTTVGSLSVRNQLIRYFVTENEPVVTADTIHTCRMYITEDGVVMGFCFRCDLDQCFVNITLQRYFRPKILDQS